MTSWSMGGVAYRCLHLNMRKVCYRRNGSRHVLRLSSGHCMGVLRRWQSDGIMFEYCRELLEGIYQTETCVSTNTIRSDHSFERGACNYSQWLFQGDLAFVSTHVCIRCQFSITQGNGRERARSECSTLGPWTISALSFSNRVSFLLMPISPSTDPNAQCTPYLLF